MSSYRSTPWADVNAKGEAPINPHHSGDLNPLVGCNLKLPGYGRLSWLAFPPSCQPHHQVNHPLSTSWEVQQSGSVWIHLSGAKPCVCLGCVAPAVTEIRSLFPQFRGSIWESCRQKVHRTVARPRFALQNVEKLRLQGAFSKKQTVAKARFHKKHPKKPSIWVFNHL